jgi:hypothetical protein
MDCVEQLHVKTPYSWKCFVKSVKKRGIVLTVDEAYERGHEQNNLIIVVNIKKLWGVCVCVLRFKCRGKCLDLREW